MFLVGGFSRLGLNATAAGDTAKASQYGAAAASFVFIFTFVFVSNARHVAQSTQLTSLCLGSDLVDSTVALPGRDIPTGGSIQGKCLGRCRLEYRQWLADTLVPGYVRENQRKDLLHFRNQQCNNHSDGVGSVP